VVRQLSLHPRRRPRPETPDEVCAAGGVNYRRLYGGVVSDIFCSRRRLDPAKMRPEHHALAKPLADTALGNNVNLSAGDLGSGAAAAAADAVVGAGDDPLKPDFLRPLATPAQTMRGFRLSHAFWTARRHEHPSRDYIDCWPFHDLRPSIMRQRNAHGLGAQSERDLDADAALLARARTLTVYTPRVPLAAWTPPVYLKVYRSTLDNHYKYTSRISGGFVAVLLCSVTAALSYKPTA
jgi:hypothetical protein